MAAPPLSITARLAAAAALLLAAGGCLVDSDEFEEAQRRKENLRAEVSKLRQDNDQLNHEINRLYADREIISGHVAMTAAVALHNQMTAGIRPAQPAAAPAPAARPATPVSRPAPAARPAETGARGGAVPPPPPAAQDADPPPTPAGLNRPSGAVDWGR
jgi:hypothetical protein